MHISLKLLSVKDSLNISISHKYIIYIYINIDELFSRLLTVTI